MDVIAPSSSFDPTPRRWLFGPLVPAGELTLLTGARRAGKGLWCARLAACVSRGVRSGFDLCPDPLPGHSVLWVTGGTSEDQPAEIMARYLAADGEPKRVRIEALSASQGLAGVRDLLEEIEGPRLVIADPLQALIGDLSSPRARERAEELVGLAREHDATIVAIQHLNNRGEPRGRGEIADVARSQLFIGRHPGDGDLIVLAQAPSSYGEGDPIAYRVAHLPDDRVALAAVTEDWDDDVELVDLLPRPPTRRPTARRTRSERRRDFLLEVLRDGPRPRPDVILAGRRRGFGERSIERTATELGVTREERREGGTFAAAVWSLPPPPAPAPPAEWQTTSAPQVVAPQAIAPGPPSASSSSTTRLSRPRAQPSSPPPAPPAPHSPPLSPEFRPRECPDRLNERGRGLELD